jgi:NitT/TauT family transport system ATP-binding protein
MTQAATHSSQTGEVVAENIAISYEARGNVLPVLSDVSFTLRPGTSTAVIGPSGCGKSTLLMAIAGLLEPTAGRLTIGGDPVNGPHRDLGVVFQKDLLLDWRTSVENVLLQVELRSMKKAEYVSRAKGLLDTLGLHAFHNRYPRELSGGMRQRVSISRALVHRPKVLLMDEPFGALDSLTREQANIDVTEICAEEGATTLLITHSIEEAAFMSDEVLVMSPRPSRIVGRIPIHLPRPRTLALKGTPEFARCVQEIRDVFSREGVLNDHR